MRTLMRKQVAKHRLFRCHGITWSVAAAIVVAFVTLNLGTILDDVRREDYALVPLLRQVYDGEHGVIVGWPETMLDYFGDPTWEVRGIITDVALLLFLTIGCSFAIERRIRNLGKPPKIIWETILVAAILLSFHFGQPYITGSVYAGMLNVVNLLLDLCYLVVILSLAMSVESLLVALERVF